MQPFSFLCPAKTSAGVNALDHLPFELMAMGAQKPMVIMDLASQEAGLHKRLSRAFAGSGMTLGIHAPVTDNPEDLALFVKSAHDLFSENGYDALIALGGSRAANTAKALNIAVSMGPEALHKGVVSKGLAPLVFLPTVTDVMSGASQRASYGQVSFDSPFLSPSLVLMDPDLLVPEDRNTLLDHALTCLALGCEVFAVSSGPPARAYAGTLVSLAWTLLGPLLASGLKGPDDLRAAARENLACQRHLVQTSVLAGYLMSGPEPRFSLMIGKALAARSRLSQGQIMALVLPAVLESCPAPALGKLLGHLSDATTYCAVPGPQQPLAAVQILRNLVHRLFSLSHGLLPRTLGEAGWTPETLAPLAGEMAEALGLNPDQVCSLNSILSRAVDGRPKGY